MLPIFWKEPITCDTFTLCLNVSRLHAVYRLSHLYFALVVAFAGLLLKLHAVQFCSQSLHGFLPVLQLGPFLLALCNHA